MEPEHTAAVDAARQGLLSLIRAETDWPDCEHAAVKLACAMLAESADDAAIIGELQEAGLTREGAEEVVATAKAQLQAAARLADAALPFDESDGGVPHCPHCLEPVGPRDHFCPKCCGPVTAHASTDPMGQIYATGYAYQQAVSARPRAIVVLGMWLIFAPQIPALIFGGSAAIAGLVTQSSIFGIGDGLFAFPRGEGYFVAMLGVIFFGGLAVLYIAILWKVTARYLRYNRRPLYDAAVDEAMESDEQQ